jgi:universal stress protein E
MDRFDKILLLVDGEEPETVVIEKSIDRASALGASLTLASVVPGSQGSRFFSVGGPSAEELERVAVAEEMAKLESLAAAYADRGLDLSARVLIGKPAIAVAKAVRDDGFKMVWKAPVRARKVGDRLLGSFDMRLIRACPCPVAVIDDRQRVERDTVFVVALEIAPAAADQEYNERLNRHILTLALDAMTGVGHRLHVVHAWTLYGESILESPRFSMPSDELATLRENERDARLKNLKELLADFKAGLSSADARRFDPEVHLVKGDPNTAIPATIRELEADILVMGTVSRSGLPGLILGNTAEEILHRLECSVAIAKPEDFVSPVELR